MKLKAINGTVTFIQKAGKDFVKHLMPVASAEKIVKNGKTSHSDKFEGFPLCVDDTYYFAATAPKSKTESKE